MWVSSTPMRQRTLFGLVHAVNLQGQVLNIGQGGPPIPKDALLLAGRGTQSSVSHAHSVVLIARAVAVAPKQSAL